MDFPISSITLESKHYPPLLRHIPDPPLVLYVRGNPKVLTGECFSIVGTRLLTDYGKRAGTDLATGVARAGFTIVSGLAIGIDALAHRTALAEKTPTVAVVGSGLSDDILYPHQNLRLAYEIMKAGGALLSEYEPQVRAQLFTFPARNRIISGMSKGVLIVEGDIKSGTMITAKAALDQGRDVFAVPGPMYAAKSQGTNYLIQKGAKLVLKVEDILEEYGIYLHSTDIKASNPNEASIMKALGSEALTVDEIIRASKLDTAAVAATLMVMEMEKKVRNLGNGKYVVYS